MNLTSVGMPNGDDGAYYWLQNFANQIVEDRTIRQLAYVTDEQVDRVVKTVAAFDEAYMTASCEVTRTSPNIEAKDLARNAAVRAAWGARSRQPHQEQPPSDDQPAL